MKWNLLQIYSHNMLNLPLTGDYASALDSVWPHFAAVGVKRTSKADLISKGIIFKIEKTVRLSYKAFIDWLYK